MNRNVKNIIFGFVLMFMGGVLLITGAIQSDMPTYMVLLSYGFFIGPLIIIINLFTYPQDNNKQD